MRHRTPKTSSIEKALEILMVFSRYSHEIGTVELSHNLNLHPATVNRILQILSRKGFLQQNERTRKFSFGPSVFQLGRKIFQSLSGNLPKIAAPYIEILSEELGRTVLLEVMSGKNSIVAYLEQGSRGYLIGPKIGDVLPNHAAAGAKAMLAFYDQDSIENFLHQKMKRLTPKTITNLKTFKLELGKVREQGVAFCQEEMAIGVNALGVPIFNHDDKAIAGLVVADQTSKLECNIKSPTVIALKKPLLKYLHGFFTRSQLRVRISML
ncbi:MAG: IclR family transcriptional regulator [Pseudomonadota bacterium]